MRVIGRERSLILLGQGQYHGVLLSHHHAVHSTVVTIDREVIINHTRLLYRGEALFKHRRSWRPSRYPVHVGKLAKIVVDRALYRVLMTGEEGKPTRLICRGLHYHKYLIYEVYHL